METFANNIICIVVLSIILLSMTLQNKIKDKSSVRFSVLAHMVLSFLITDLICEILDGRPGASTVTYIFNLLDYYWIDGIIIAFSAYLETLVGRPTEKWKFIMNPGVAFSFARVVVITVLAATGSLFVIDEKGCYQERPLSVIPYIMLFVILGLLMIVAAHNRHSFKAKHFGVVIAYLVLPIIGGILEMITGCYAFSIMSITASVLLIYTLIQSGMIEDFRVREALLEEISQTDLLTNLNNRRAYYGRLNEIGAKDSVGTVFCDINGLKYINDTLGHAEGDRLIVAFSKILLTVFEKNDVYRISGDEFVVIVPTIKQDEFDKKVEKLEKIVKNENSIGSLGSAFGSGAEIEQLVSKAENQMYISKREYYDTIGAGRGEAVGRRKK